MKQLATALLLTLLTVAGGRAATIGELMVSEPGQVFALLTQDVRRQMVQAYSDTGKRVMSANRLQGDSKIVQMDDRHLMLASSKSSTIELQLLTSGRDSVVAVITTVQLPAPDSRIDFYDTSWQPLKRPDKVFGAPTMADFVKPDAPKAEASDLLASITFPLVTYTFAGPTHNVLVAEQRLADFYHPTEYKKMAPLLTERIGYTVSGTKLKRMK